MTQADQKLIGHAKRSIGQVGMRHCGRHLTRTRTTVTIG